MRERYNREFTKIVSKYEGTEMTVGMMKECLRGLHEVMVTTAATAADPVAEPVVASPPLPAAAVDAAPWPIIPTSSPPPQSTVPLVPVKKKVVGRPWK